MFLKYVLKGSSYEKQVGNTEISKICRDSRLVQKKDVFFCLSADEEKAKDYCYEALARGAEFVVSEFELNHKKSLKVEDVRDLFALSCANFYARACDDLKIIGVTGTNGKTTTTHIIKEILQRNGKKVGVIGTNGISCEGLEFDSKLTTPDADILHESFWKMRNRGVEYVVMEVSAHAIDQKRINHINFELGILTNITQDHLDYFGTMENYAQTKFKFLSKKYVKKAIICVDDELVSKLETDVPVTTYAIKNPSDVFAMETGYFPANTTFLANVNDEVFRVKTNLVGEYNVYNTLAALAACQSLGLKANELEQGCQYITPAEGRFNVISFSGVTVVIDFAHTPDGLLQVLKTAKELVENKLYLVFGCGGDRDKDKRHQMGKIAEEFADFVCLTDDNPRFENSLDIIADIEKGMTKGHLIETDRRKAIFSMLELCKEGDMIIIAGKGSEKYQVVGDTYYPYNDFDVVVEFFNKKLYNFERSSIWS